MGRSCLASTTTCTARHFVRGVLGLTLVLCAPCGVRAQRLPFVHLTTGQGVVGLPSASVQTVYQDRIGFIWMGFFSSGLGRYDGRQLELYGLADGLVDSTVRTVVEDGEGYLWVGAETGVVVSERRLETYGPGERLRFVARVGGTDLARARIRRGWIVPDPAGGVWVATVGAGVLHYRRTQGSGMTVRRLDLAAAAGGAERPLALTVARDGTVWLAIERGGLLVLSPGTTEPAPPRLTVPQAPVSALREGPSGRLWAGCRDGSVWSYEPGSTGFRLVSRRLKEQISSLLETSTGEVWATSLGDGALLLRPDGPPQGTRIGRREGLPNETAWEVLEDREHNLWIAHNAGVSRLRYDYRAFLQLTGEVGPGEAPVLPEPSSFAVVPPDPAGGDELLWVATGGGLVAVAPDGRSAVLTSGDGLRSSSVYALARDQRGRLWAGTLRGLDVLASSPADLPTPVVRARPVTLLGRRLWMASYGLDTIYDIRLFDLARTAGGDRVGSVWISGIAGVTCHAAGHWFRLGPAAGLPLAGASVTAIDAAGHLWVGSRDSGVYRSAAPVDLARLERVVEHGQRMPWVRTRLVEPFWNSDRGARSDSVLSLLWVAPRMWLGSAAGLDAFAGEAAPVLRLDRGDGLGGDRVVGVARGSGGTLWVAQDEGLAEVDSATGAVRRLISKADGLVDNEAWGPDCVAVGASGEVLLATPKGVTRYRPWFDSSNPLPPPLVLRRVQLTGGEGGHNEVVIRYAALSFASERSVRYRTRLLGYDDEWSAPTTDVLFRYTNLPAALVRRGYTFEVTAANDDGVWSPAPLRYTFHIRPPWWLTWWAVLGYAGLLGLAWSALAVVRTRRLTRRTHELEELVAERTAEIRRYALELEETSREAAEASAAKSAFLATMSHELRTPLNSIIGFSEILIARLTGVIDPPLAHFLGNIHSSGSHLLSLINDILDLSKVEAGQMRLVPEPCDLAAVVDGVCRIMGGVCAKRDIELGQDIPADLGPVVADGPKVKQILYNLLSNAVKFSPDGSRVTVRARALAATDSPLGVDSVALAVEDQGIGIAAADRDAVFEEFRQLDNGAARRYVGTGLGLALVRRFVELHGGRVEVESELGRGSTFTILLPRDGSGDCP